MRGSPGAPCLARRAVLVGVALVAPGALVIVATSWSTRAPLERGATQVATIEIPGLDVHPRIVRLERVTHGTTAVAHFQMSSTRGSTFRISGVAVSCGCMGATVSGYTVTPAGPVDITVRSDTSKIQGNSFEKHAAVSLAGYGPGREIPLTVAGTVDTSGEVTVVPAALNFGRVAKGTVARRQVYVRAAPNVLAEFPSEIALSGGGTTVLRLLPDSASTDTASLRTVPLYCRLAVGEDIADGPFQSEIRFHVGHDTEGASDIVVKITGAVTGPIVSAPASLLMLFPRDSAPPPVTFALRSITQERLRIAVVRASLPVDVRIVQAGPTSDGEIWFEATARPPKRDVTIGAITCIAEDGSSIMVPIVVARTALPPGDEGLARFTPHIRRIDE